MQLTHEQLFFLNLQDSWCSYLKISMLLFKEWAYTYGLSYIRMNKWWKQFNYRLEYTIEFKFIALLVSTIFLILTFRILSVAILIPKISFGMNKNNIEELWVFQFQNGFVYAINEYGTHNISKILNWRSTCAITQVLL